MTASIEHYNILRRPVVTEKSYAAIGQANQYTFRVDRRASRQQIKQAVEAIFEVKVEKVQMISVPGKPKRRGMHSGRRSGYCKAVVRLAEGQSIELMEEA